ncbi:MAG TPA: proton-conducting transporter membrane subunit [Gemmatimonas sp.]|nr:proton-conducting transporter membrane subunit [Gemmatimonas sp.]
MAPDIATFFINGSVVAPGIIIACALTLLFAPHIASRERGGWAGEVALALLMVASLATSSGAMSFGATAATAFVIAVEAYRVSRTASLTLALSGVALVVAAAAMAAGQAELAFVASIVSFAMRVGVFPLHSGIASLTDRSLTLQLQQLATLPTSVFVHLRFVDHEPIASELAPYIVVIGAASTLAFALIALVQRTLVGLLRNSVLMHGGMLFAAVGAAGRGHHAAALLVAITLGLALSGFGIMLASFQARVGPLELLGPGGRARAFPRLAVGVALFGGAAVGMPGTSGFVADDLLLHALWLTNVPSAVTMIIASALLAVATLAGFSRAFLGKPLRMLAPDLEGGERLVLVVLVLWLVVLGLAPGLLVDPATALLR